MNIITRPEFRLPHLFNGFFNDINNDTEHKTKPSVNVKNLDDKYLVELAVPGMKKKDIEINIEEDLLTISSIKQNEVENQNDEYTVREFSYQEFKRTFRLPKYVLKNDIKAKYENGILLLTIPKEKNESKLLRKVEIA